jgi:hypothetical protein
MPHHFGEMTVILKDLPEVKRFLKERQDILDGIYEWVKKKSAPSQSYGYSRCVICDCTWWDGREIHRFDCWVPDLGNICERKTGDL